MADCVTVATTTDNPDEAKTLAACAVERRLAAVGAG